MICQSCEQITRLHQDLNINPEGIDAINHLLKYIEEMKQEIVHLRNRLRFLCRRMNAR